MLLVAMTVALRACTAETLCSVPRPLAAADTGCVHLASCLPPPEPAGHTATPVPEALGWGGGFPKSPVVPCPPLVLSMSEMGPWLRLSHQGKHGDFCWKRDVLSPQLVWWAGRKLGAM